MASALVSILSIFSFFLISLPLRLYFSQIETCLILTGLVSAYAFIKSELTDNYSQIDEFWSMLPVFYTFHLTHWTARGTLMFLIVLTWGCRLSFNFYRKGGYQGLEDYRWEHVRKIIPGGIIWHIFNLTFISTYQTFILFGLCLPAYLEPQTPLDLIDLATGGLCLAFIAGETWADQQQWNFQTEKQRKVKSGEKVVNRFLNQGLFKYSRHPNFFCELSLWWTFFGFARGEWLAGVGVVLLNLLFHSSTDFTEKLSVAKYPEYKEYQETTPRIFPWFGLKGKKE